MTIGHSAFFNSPQAAAKAMRDGPLALASLTYPGIASLSDTFLWGKVLAAESEVERRLTLPLEPVEIYTDPPSQAEIDALAGKPYQIEPGYDLAPDFFGAQKWGALILRIRPVIEILSMKIVYPGYPSAVFEVPLAWIRADADYGHIHVYPTVQLTSLPISLYTVRVMGGGVTVPNMIRIRYRAGLQQTHLNYPDIYDLTLRFATARILSDMMLPQSESISADGLSQSRSMDMSKAMEELNEQLARIRDAMLGPQMMVM
jgi:hypothetical protein